MNQKEIKQAEQLLADRTQMVSTICLDTGGQAITAHWIGGGQRIFYSLREIQSHLMDLKHKRTDAALRKVFSSMTGDSSDEIRRSYYTAIDNLQALVDLLLIEDGKLPANRQDGDCLRNEYILAKQAVAALGPSRLGAVL